MNALFNIAILNGVEVVSARELYNYLEIDTKFYDWSKRMFEYGFIANKDYTEVLLKNELNSKGGRPAVDYALTIRTAKEISMLQRTEKGKQARNYFLDIEEAKNNQPKSQAELILQSAQMLVDIEKRQTQVEQRLTLIEAKNTVTVDLFTVVGFATLQKRSINRETAIILGKKATAICKLRNLMTDKVKDPRFGYVKLYPTDVLKEVFTDYFNN